MDDKQIAALGLNPAQFNDAKIGFHADLYRLPSGKYVLGFKGTADLASTIADWHQIRNQEVPAYAKAAKLAQRVSAQTNGNVEFTGHSLGGGEASVAALMTGKAGYTVNAEGVNTHMIGELGLPVGDADRLITAYHVHDEFVTGAQKAFGLPQALGHSVELPATFHGHSINGAVDALSFVGHFIPVAKAAELAVELFLHKEVEVEDSIRYTFGGNTA